MPRRLGERLIVEGIVRDATAEVTAEERLRETARTDALTGLFNRRHFSEVLEAELERSRRESLTPGLALVDVDHFKTVNDTYGHQVGDAVLSEVAGRLRRCRSVVRLRGSLGRRGVHRARPGARSRTGALAGLPGSARERRRHARDRRSAATRHHGLGRWRAGRSDGLARADRRPGRPRAVLGQAPGT